MQFDIPEDLNQDSRGEVIPFGKYKGQPIEVLAQDDQYRDWLMAQDWFRSRFPQLVQIVVNNFGAPSETPEHNQMQAAFLEPAWMIKFVHAIARNSIPEDSLFWWLFNAADYGHYATEEASRRRNSLETPPATPSGYTKNEWQAVIQSLRRSAFAESLARHSGKPVGVVSVPQFEAGKKLIDVRFEISAFGLIQQTRWFRTKDVPYGDGQRHYTGSDVAVEAVGFGLIDRWIFDVELKPTIGDEYPTILRQMRENGAKFLLYRKYTGGGVDETTFRKLFKSQAIVTIREDEVSGTAAKDFAVLSTDLIQALIAVN